MPLMLVENQEPNPTILPIPGQEPFVWQTKGDPRGGDVQRLPDALIDELPFIQALENGCLRVVEATEEAKARLAALRIGDTSGLRRAQAEQAREGIEGSITRRQNRDIVAESCLGPGPRGGEGGCSNPVLRRQGERGTDQPPPLCTAHGYMADQFFLVESPAGAGQTQSTWARVSA